MNMIDQLMKSDQFKYALMDIFVEIVCLSLKDDMVLAWECVTQAEIKYEEHPRVYLKQDIADNLRVIDACKTLLNYYGKDHVIKAFELKIEEETLARQKTQSTKP